MLYVLCYDIVSNRRRKKVADALLDFGGRVQKSTFECDLKTEAKLRELLARVRPLLNPKTDTLRVYRVCAACRQECTLAGLDLAPPPLKKTIIV